MIRPTPLRLLFALVLLPSLTRCVGTIALDDPAAAIAHGQAPDSFAVTMVTSDGPIEMIFHRSWSPAAVDRAYLLMANGFYTGSRFHRMIPGFVAQFGMSGIPALDSAWEQHPVEDEPPLASNTRGTISFARGGPRTRTTQLFINLRDNRQLDAMEFAGVTGFPAIGRVTSGMEIADSLYGGYGDPWELQDSTMQAGRAYLARSYPLLDSIVEVRVTETWTGR